MVALLRLLWCRLARDAAEEILCTFSASAEPRLCLTLFFSLSRKSDPIWGPVFPKREKEFPKHRGKGAPAFLEDSLCAACVEGAPRQLGARSSGPIARPLVPPDGDAALSGQAEKQVALTGANWQSFLLARHHCGNTDRATQLDQRPAPIGCEGFNGFSRVKS